MTDSQIQLVVTVVVAMAGSSALTAWVTARQVRGRTDAETESLRVHSADILIKQLMARLEVLEKAKDEDEHKIERLTSRVYQLERTMVAAGIDIPPQQMV